MLFKKYKEEIIPKMKEKFDYNSDSAVPKIEKIVVNVGIGRLSQQPNFDKNLEFILNDIALITGQKPALTSAKKSIAGFKIRAGQTIGLKITLRRLKMYDFIQRLINIVLPRMKDFRGISVNNVDESGNLNIGIKEHIIFPEISADTIKFDFGFQISIVSNAKTKEEAIELYKLLRIPFKKHG
ncbi:MAG: 50S ribosomal protein L5 [Patescibacteria group bacterium]